MDVLFFVGMGVGIGMTIFVLKVVPKARKLTGLSGGRSGGGDQPPIQEK